MARGKGKRKAAPHYLKTIEEARGRNAQSLAKYIRDRFGQHAAATEGKEVLLDKVVKLHDVARRPLAGKEDGPDLPAGPEPERTPAPAPQAPAQEPSPIASAAGEFADAILGRLDVSKPKNVRPVPECEPNEHWEGTMRVTAPGDFPEAAQYPILQRFTRERDMNHHVWFRDSSGRRLMLGKIVEISAQQNYRGVVPAVVNTMRVHVPRERKVGVPLPHWRLIEQSYDTEPMYTEAHDVPLGQHQTPNAPPPPLAKKMKTYPITTYGDCLCDPRTLEIVHVLTQVQHTLTHYEPEPIELQGSAI